MSFFSRIVLVAGFALYAALFGEFFLRAFSPQSFIPREVTGAPYGVRMNKPGAVYRQRTPETSAVVRINGQGLRADREFSLEKPAAATRIAIFGDSYFLGYEAPIEEIAATQIEADLRAAQCPVEVLNFAVSGFGTGEMLRTLEAKGLAFHPDVVIFQWHHSDPDDNLRSNLYRLGASGLEETGAVYEPAMGLRETLEANAAYQFIANHSHLFAAGRERASRFIRRAMAGHVFSRATTTGADVSAERMASETDIAMLARAEADAKTAGALFYVVDVPGVQSRTRFNSSFRLLPDRLVSRANYLSPINAFDRAASNDRKIYWEKGQKHLTPYGNAVLAQMVAESLLADEAARTALDCRAGEARDRLAERSR
ncbi:MAG: SGNH/GDSL hydrolase family protein [Parvularculaceae bacterium]